MNDAQKRQHVSDLYAGPKWKKQVEKMPDDQVTAIYLKHMDDGSMPEGYDDLDQPEEEIIENPTPPEPILNVPRNGRGPHHNEDDFETY